MTKEGVTDGPGWGESNGSALLLMSSICSESSRRKQDSNANCFLDGR